MTLVAFVNALVLLVALSVGTSQVVFTVAAPQVQVPLRLHVSGAVVTSDAVEAIATGPVTTTVSFQWRTAVREVPHPRPIVVPAGTRVSLCLLAGVATELSGNTTCVSPRAQFRTTKAAVLDGEPCDIPLILSFIYVSCGDRAAVPAVPDGGSGLLPFTPNTEVYADYSRAVTVSNAAGERAGATIHAKATLPVRATLAADVARANTKMREQVTTRAATYGRHIEIVRFEQSPLADISLDGGRPRLVPRTRAVFYTDEQLRDGVRGAYQRYVNGHQGMGAPNLDRIRVLSASVASGSTTIAMAVEVAAAPLTDYRVSQLGQGCAPSVCEHRLTTAGFRVVSVRHSRPWLSKVDVAADVLVLVQRPRRPDLLNVPRVR